MITLTLDWREVLWWMQGGMAGSHLRWSVYEDMVNKVWPQCSEQERRSVWLIMRRDLGTYWRPDGWGGFNMETARGEGAWRADDQGYAIDRKDADGKPRQVITDLTPWMYFRQVLARFDPENQFAVTLPVRTSREWDEMQRTTPECSIIKKYLPDEKFVKAGCSWECTTSYIVVRTYKWRDPGGSDAYFIDWSRRCDPDRITNTERIEIPDEGTM